MSHCIAFYAPLKSPKHPVPSGDRLIARMLFRALKDAGFNPLLASELRSRDKGDPARQQRLREIGERLADRLIRRWSRQGIQPRLWFTYHLYYKAPDWVGPAVARKLGIPYVCAEASWASKRADGPWQISHQAVTTALQQSKAIFCLNPNDQPALAKLLGRDAPLVTLPAFIDTQLPQVTISRKAVAQRWGLNEELPWLISVAMMRPGDKQASYEMLFDSLQQVTHPCQIILVGNGVARPELEQKASNLTNVCFTGALPPEHIQPLLQHSQLYLWPAVNEAFGMAFLEAQCQGLPVIAGNEGGVSSVVADGKSGVLTPPRDSTAFSAAISQMLDDSEKRYEMAQFARNYIQQQHSVESAAMRLKTHLEPLINA